MPFTWTLNPYRGCTHGCHYCFARRYHAQLEMGPGDEFSSVIFIKVNFADVLRRELAKQRGKNDLVAFGTATDPYQPVEGRYRLSQQVLKALIDYPIPVGLITKGPLVVRDQNLLVELSQRTRCTVSMSIPTVDEEAWQRLEPGTAHPLQRLRAVKSLREAGIDAGVLMAPIVPGISSHPAKLERTIQAIADHGATYIGTSLLHLEGGTRTHFMGFLKREYPLLVGGYGRLYAGKYADKWYSVRLQTMLSALKIRHGITTERRPQHGQRQVTTDPSSSSSNRWKQRQLTLYD